MAEKLGAEQVPPPGVKRDLQPFKSLKAEPVKLSEGGESSVLTAQDVAELDADRPAQAIEVTADEMGVASPVYDRSQQIEYYFYKCSYEHCNKGKYSESTVGIKPRLLPAEAREDSRRETTECTCILEPRKKKAYQNPKIEAIQYEHGVMKLYHFTAPRPA